MSLRSITAEKSKQPARFLPASINLERREIDVIWSTGSRVLRSDYEYGNYYEELSLEPDHVRIDRFKNGAPVLNNHNLLDQIGVVERAWIENGVGYATIRFSKRAEVEPIWLDIADGIYRNISVGYKVYQAKEIHQENDFPILRAIDTEFFELSLVSVNADALAQVRSEQNETHKLILIGDDETMKTSQTQPSPADQKMGNNTHDESTESSEGSKANQTKTAKPKNTPPFKEEGASHTRGLPEEQTREIANLERLRIRSIEDLCQTHQLGQDFRLRLIDGGVSIAKAKELILDQLAERCQKEAIHNQGHHLRVQPGVQDELQTRREAIKNAILFNHNPHGVDLLDAAKPFVHRSLTDIIRIDLEKRGEKTAALSNHEIATRAFHSTSDFPILMGEIAQAKIVQSYNALMKKQTFTPLIRYENASNFKPMRKIQMGEIPSLERIPEGAEVTYGTISEHQDQWAIASYGKAFGISRQTIINDDYGLILSAMEMWGAAVSRLESNLVWALFKQNVNKWFSKDHGNISKAFALNLDSLEEAEYMMSVQRGHDKREGDELNIIPEYLIVPSRLKNTAQKLIYGAYQPVTLETVNIYHNQLKIISEARLNPEPGQAYPWYLACDPSTLPVIWMAYLGGKRSPTITHAIDFDTLSVKVRADIDFGVTTGDWRAVHMNPGVKRQGE